MLERFFRPKTEEQTERDLFRVGSREFEEIGVNAISMHQAFCVLKEENQKNIHKFTNNRLLNIVRDCALSHASPIEDIVMGGPEEVNNRINQEIEILRSGLSEEERGD